MNISKIKVLHTDFKTAIDTYILNMWQELWHTHPNNKLCKTKRTLGIRHHNTGLSQRDVVVLARIRIGHANIIPSKR